MGMGVDAGRRWRWWLAALVLLGAMPAQAARLALVVGNDSYAHVPGLRNARADADAIAQALVRAGWQVQLHKDRPLRQMQADIRAFRQLVAGGDEVVVFFSGHGVQLGGTNYLLPTDVGADSEEQVKDDAVSLGKLLADLRERQPRFLLAIVDACRDNPFTGAGRAIGGRGLTGVAGASGQMVIYAAGEGQRALDGLGAGDTVRNGVFTRVLLREMARPGLPIREVLYRVRDEVASLAESVRHEQVPAVYDQVRGTFYFVPPAPVAPLPPVAVAAPAALPPVAASAALPPTAAPTAPPPAASPGAPSAAVLAALQPGRPAQVARAPAAGLQPGQVLVYRITDLFTGNAREVRLRLDRLDGEQAVFDAGNRVEQAPTGRLLGGQPHLGDLDRFAPPQGWWQATMAEGQAVERQYPLAIGVAATVSGTVKAERRAVAGGAEQQLLVWKPQLTTVPSNGVSYQGEFEVWFSPALGRVVEFRSLIRSSAPAASPGLLTRERVQLLRIE